MVLWIICGFLAAISLASWIICIRDSSFKKIKTYLAGKFALILLLLIFGISKGLNFFIYDQEIREIQIEQIARFNDGGKDKILAVIEIDGENLAFEISKNSDLGVGDKLKISRKSSKFPTFDNWSEDWVVKKISRSRATFVIRDDIFHLWRSLARGKFARSKSTVQSDAETPISKNSTQNPPVFEILPKHQTRRRSRF